MSDSGWKSALACILELLLRHSLSELYAALQGSSCLRDNHESVFLRTCGEILVKKTRKQMLGAGKLQVWNAQQVG